MRREKGEREGAPPGTRKFSQVVFSELSLHFTHLQDGHGGVSRARAVVGALPRTRHAQLALQVGGVAVRRLRAQGEVTTVVIGGRRRGQIPGQVNNKADEERMLETLVRIG